MLVGFFFVLILAGLVVFVINNQKKNEREIRARAIQRVNTTQPTSRPTQQRRTTSRAGNGTKRRRNIHVSQRMQDSVHHNGNGAKKQQSDIRFEYESDGDDNSDSEWWTDF